MSWQTIVKNNNLDVSEINLSSVLGRLDAEYYRPEYLFMIDLLSKKSVRMKDLFSVGNYGVLPDSKDYGGGSTYLVRGVDLRSNLIEEVLLVKVPDHYYTNKCSIKKNDVLLLVKGATIGSSDGVILAQKNYENAIFNGSIFRIRPNNKINSGYLFIFMGTRYFTFQKIREVANSGIEYNSINTIRNYLVPIPPEELQNKIAELSEIFHKKQLGAEMNYKEAERLFLKEINLEGYKATGENVSVRNFVDCIIDNRFDAEYWQPKYDEIVKRVSSIPQMNLSEIVSVKKGVETGSEAYSEEGKLFIRVSDFSIYGIDEGEKRISEELYDELKEKYRPLKGEVLFTKDGTIGISFALHEDVDVIVSGAFLRMKPKVKINTDYLALVLNSSYCKSQIERMSGGAIIAHLKPDSAMKIKIPMLSDKKQEELAEKVSDALRLRKEAKALLEKAKRAVEIFIEQDEKEALLYLNK